VTAEAAAFQPPGNFMPESTRYSKDQMLPLEPRERAQGTPYGVQWWVALLFFGKSTPIPDDYVAHAKWKWYQLYGLADWDSLLKEAKDELDGLRASTGDILSRIAVVAVVAALGIQPVQSLVTGATTWGTIFSWSTLALIGLTILCLIVIVTPKLKVWAKQRLFVGKLPVVLELMEDRDAKGWYGYLRLTRKIEHRKQLIRFERRLQVVAGTSVTISMITLALSLHFH
jgi:hypothetical protein